jgi:two-component system response regulator HydG
MVTFVKIHRINEFSIDSPSLVDRAEDLMIFAEFLAKANEQLYKEVIGFLARSFKFFKIIRIGKFKGNAKLRQKNPIDTRRFIKKNVLPSEFFQSRARSN